MSFSSRHTANHRQRLTRTRTGGKRGAQSARHLRLWDAIRLTRAELSDWQQRTTLIEGLFRQHILPRETQLTGACGELTERLIDSYAEHWLGAAEQALLNLWISDNLQSLANHPFAPEGQREALNRRWSQLQTVESGLDRHDAKNSGTLLDDLFDDELNEDDDIFDFGWHGDGRSPDTATDGETPRNKPSAASPDPLADRDTETEETGKTDSLDRQHEKTIQQLEQRLSVERLFRQLARTLHPDREQDETRKAEKHELMSECLHARRNKDINTLLTLYCEHIGNLPDDLTGDEHEELIQALEQQLRQLQTELRQERFGNSLHGQIVERYSASNDKTIRQRVQQHADSLDQEIARLQDRLQQVNCREGLLAELADRREIEQNRMVIDSMTGYSSKR